MIASLKIVTPNNGECRPCTTLWYTWIFNVCESLDCEHRNSHLIDTIQPTVFNLVYAKLEITCSFFQLCVLVFQDAPNIIVNGSIIVWYLYQVIRGLVKFCQWQNQRRHGFANFAVTNGYTHTAENVRLWVSRWIWVAQRFVLIICVFSWVEFSATIESLSSV